MSAINKLVENTLLIISQSKPILIDTQEHSKRTLQPHTISSLSKLPAFEPDGKTTRILYSKFLVKGVTPINSNIMFSKIKANMQRTEGSQVAKGKDNLVRERIVTQQTTKSKQIKQINQNQRQLGVFQLQKSVLQPFDKSRPQTAFQRSHSHNQLGRPQSAAHLNSFKRGSRNNSVQRLSQAKGNRSQTAVTRASSAKNINRFQVEGEPAKVWPILALTDQNNNLKGINYIQRNKREASLKKPISFDTQLSNNFTKEHVQKLKDKVAKKEAKPSERPKLTEKQREEIKQKHTKYLNYLKQNRPQQYNQCMNYLSTLDENGKEEQKSIYFMNFEQETFEPTRRQAENRQVEAYHEDFYNMIVDVEYGIKKTKAKQMYIQPSSSILNVYECQELIRIFQQTQKDRQPHHIASYKERVMQIIKNLQFFKNQKVQVLRSMLQMNYSIQQVPSNIQIVHQNDPITKVYVILNGSVTKKNKEQDKDLIDFNTHLPEFFTTLFDGQTFGLPSKPKDKILQYSIRTLQNCLLMSFPYSQYRKALSNNQNIDDRIELLKRTLSNQEKGKLGKEDLQIVAFQMQTVNFSAQQIVYRQDQACDNLVIIASGKVAICFQSIIRRKKMQSTMLKNRNQIIPQYSINQCRRKNLKNYQLIHQNNQEIIYYQLEVVQEKIRGDVLNWEGFHHRLQSLLAKKTNSYYFASFSALALQDNTTVYQLPPQKVQNFPPHIQSSILNKAEVSKSTVPRRDANKMQRWQGYKQELVRGILGNKK